VRSLSFGEIEARKQIDDIHTYLKNYVPGFEKCYFTKTAPFLGIRETRRIVAHYMMTQEDVLGCRHFDDAIAVASYPIDIHRPGDEGCTLIWCGDCYDIPFRSLLPQKVKNLIVAGRCIGTTHEAMGAIRVMATCMAIVALVDRKDRHHRVLRKAFEARPNEWLLPWAILPEVDYLLGAHVGAAAQEAFLEDLADGSYDIDWGRHGDLEAAARLHKQSDGILAVVMVSDDREKLSRFLATDRPAR
jgi:hypothetical protein